MVLLCLFCVAFAVQIKHDFVLCFRSVFTGSVKLDGDAIGMFLATNLHVTGEKQGREELKKYVSG